MELTEFLRTICDDGLTVPQFDSIEQETKFLMGRSKHPFIRNLMRPIGEYYAVIAYDRNHILKLVKKPKWGGYVLCLVLWDFLIIDVDNKSQLECAIKDLTMMCPNDNFYIHSTPRGYHIYLMSRLIHHSSKEAINMRIAGKSDPAHATNSLYTGSSIRLSKKPGDTVLPSVYHSSFGSGIIDPEALQRYNICLHYLSLFQNFYTDKLTKTPAATEILRNLHLETLKKNDFGLHHVLTTAPFRIDTENGRFRLYENNTIVGPELKSVWKLLVAAKDFADDERDIVLASVKKTMQMRNLYQILDATADYAYGVHVQETLYFVSYKDLLMVDYDRDEDLQYLIDGLEPWMTFRIVKTNRGYHCFLTSRRIPFNSDESYRILRKVKSDIFHALGAWVRGYSVRVNHKHENDRYEELEQIGSAPEDEELVKLYKMHIDLYNKHKNEGTRCYNEGKKNTIIMIDDIVGSAVNT